MRQIRREMSPGILIGIVFLVIGALFAFVIISVARQQTPAPATASAPATQESPAASPPPTVAVTALRNVSATTSFSLDVLNDTSLAGPPPMPITIASGVPITLRGWAVDVPNSAAAGGVIISVDAANYQATYGMERQDVATALGNPAYRLSGFTITFPANMLAPGSHTITIKILTKDQKSYYQPDQTVTVAIGSSTTAISPTVSSSTVVQPTASLGTVVQSTSSSSIPLDALIRLSGMTTFSIDSLNDTSFAQPPTAPIPIPRNGSVILRGWAVDAPAGTVAGGVIVSVDETMNFQAVYGVARQDVADALGNPAYQKSGFNVTFPASKLSPGRHTITIKILTSDRKSYYEPDQKVDIEIT